jgi:hypothetical protein
MYIKHHIKFTDQTGDGNMLKYKKWLKSGMTKHIIQSTETSTTSLKSGKTQKNRPLGIPNVSRAVPKPRNGRERREEVISITPGDFNATILSLSDDRR